MTTGHAGITIGDIVSTAAHRRAPADSPTVTVLPTTLRFDAEGAAHLGEDPGPEVFTRFVEVVGHERGVDNTYRPEDLMANAVNCLRALVTDLHGGIAPITTLTYPAAWSVSTVTVLRDALDHAGLQDLEMMPDAVAAAGWAASGGYADDTAAAALGALLSSEGSVAAAPVENDSANTDAIPIVLPAPALAFSEAIPIQFEPSIYTTEPATEAHAAANSAVTDFAVPLAAGAPAVDGRPAPSSGAPVTRHRRLPVVIASAGAAAVVAAIVGLGFATGTFGSSRSVEPPAITDARTAPAEQPVPAAITTTIPFPTTQSQAPVAVPEEAVAIEPEIPSPEPVPPPAPEPAPEPPPIAIPETSAPTTAAPTTTFEIKLPTFPPTTTGGLGSGPQLTNPDGSLKFPGQR